MLKTVDIVSVNCPSTPETYHLLSAERIALMKPGSYIVNTARGEIIDEDAMIRALQDEKIAGAGLDVFQEEPLAEESKLWNMNNCLISSHSSCCYDNYRELYAIELIEKLKSFYRQ